MALGKYKSSFFTHELEPGIYTFEDISEALFTILQPEYPKSSSGIVIEYDNITTESELFLKPSFIAIKFDEKSFFSTIFGFTPGWYYKHYNHYISQKFLN